MVADVDQRRIRVEFLSENSDIFEGDAVGARFHAAVAVADGKLFKSESDLPLHNSGKVNKILTNQP